MMLLQEIEVFYWVVHYGSFSKAAAKLEVSKAHVSRGVKKLELELKVQLLYRSTRRLSLTASGELLFERAKALMLAGENAYALVSHHLDRPSGVLKITAPPAFSNEVLAEFLSGFLVRYPEVQVLLDLSSELKDILRDGIDVAIRSAVLEDSQLIAQKLGIFSNVLCASPKYLKKHGMPKVISDLAKHDCCTYYHGVKSYWNFHQGKSLKRIEIQGKIRATQIELLKKCVLSGQGLGVFPLFMVDKALSEKKLTACLSEYPMAAGEFFAIYPGGEFVPQKTRLFVSELKSFLKKKLR